MCRFFKYVVIVTNVFCFMLSCSWASAQEFHVMSSKNIHNEKSVYNNLKIGDTLPDFIIPKFINTNKRSIKSSDFIDRLLIIDFWSISCKGCIEALPLMDSLQKKFGEKIKILPVTYEKLDAVKDFWFKSKYSKNSSLTTVVEDEIFSKYFKHKTIPHEVWIYKNKVIGITNSQYVDSNNINLVLSGGNINWPIKDDFYSFDRSRKLFTLNDKQIDVRTTTLRYAGISEYKESFRNNSFSGGMGLIRDSADKNIRFYFFNQPVYNSFLLLLPRAKSKLVIKKPSNQFTIEPNEIIWDVSDIGRYKYLSKEFSGYEQDWIKDHGFCFESIYPDLGQSDSDVYAAVIRDLNLLLGLDVKWTNAIETVYVLIKIGKGNKILKLFPNQRTLSPNALISKLNNNNLNTYFFNEVDNEMKIPIDLISFSNLEELKKQLLSMGMKLERRQMEVSRLLFREIDGGLTPDANDIKKYNSFGKKDIKVGVEQNNLSFFKKNKELSNIMTTPSGLQYRILKKGVGSTPNKESKVVVKYTGRLVNGEIFESTLKNGIPQILRMSEVIEGWKEALKLMNEGSIYMLYIPAKLAYGEHTNHGNLPPNSPLIFELELLKVL